MRMPRRQVWMVALALAAIVPVATSCDAGGSPEARDSAGGAGPVTDADSAAAGAGTGDSIALPSDVRRLPPDSFTFVPDSVRVALGEAGCRVPQAAYPMEPHNVVSGELAAPGQTDWAALCARGDSTGIIVVWGGAARCDSSLAWEPNARYLQELGGGRAGFSRAIGIASMVAILRRAQAYDGPEPPARDHAGLEDVFVEKASIVRFCHEGEWIELQGSD